MQDVTDKVEFSTISEEGLSISKCVCGTEFSTWAFVIDIYSDTIVHCTNCNRGLFFKIEIKVFEVI